MPVSAQTLQMLMDAGLDGQALIEVVSSIDADHAAPVKQRSAGAIRTERYRQRGGGNIPEDLREEIMLRDDGQCQECGTFDHPQIDHIHPVSKGGVTERENLQVLCRVCNARKKDRVRKEIKRDSTDISADNSTDIPGNGGSEKKNPPNPLKENNSPLSTPTGSHSPQPRAKRDDPAEPLAEVVGHELAADLVAHRRKLKSPMTVRAARGLAKNLAACPDPMLAAETMMTKGWKSIEPEWIGNLKDRHERGQPARDGGRKPTGHDHLLAALARSCADEPGREGLDQTDDPFGSGADRGPAESHSATVVELRRSGDAWAVGEEREGGWAPSGHVSGWRGRGDG